MNFDYSQSQVLLADSLRRFLQAEYSTEQRRRFEAARNGVDQTVWQKLCELGVLGLLIDIDFGGFGESAESLLVVQREMGRALMREPVIPSAVISTVILQTCGSREQKDAWLTALADGECIGATAYLEPHSRFDIEAVNTLARRLGDEYLLDGRKSLVWHGGDADWLIVSARLETVPGLTLFLVPSDTAGLTMTTYPTMDGYRAIDLELKGVRLPINALLGSPGQGVQKLQHGLDWGIAAVCSSATGAMEKLIEDTVEHLRTRKQFGVPLSSFQSLQHRIADMLIQKELALSMAYVAVQALSDNDKSRRARMLAAAKYKVAMAGRYVGEQAIQLHGGMGMTRELPVGDYFKRLTLINPLFGDTDAQLARYSAAMA